jgi:spore germination protein KB
MLDKERIGVRQVSVLVLMFTIGTSIIIVPTLATVYAKQDGWISIILAVVIGSILVWLYASIGQYFAGKTFIQAIQTTLGKWVGSIVSLAFVVFMLILSTLVLTNIGYFVSSRILAGTPIDAIEFIFIGFVILGVRLGLETLARTAEILLPILIFLVLIFVLALLPQIEVNILKLILENGLLPVWRSSVYLIIFTFGELIIFLMLIPYVSSISRIKKGFLSGALIGGIILIVITLLAILILGGEGTSRYEFSAFTLAKKIDLGGFIQRIEVVMGGIWIISIFMKLSLCVYALTLSLRQLFQLRDQKCLTLPIGMLLIPIADWLTPNDTEYITITTKCI